MKWTKVNNTPFFVAHLLNDEAGTKAYLCIPGEQSKRPWEVQVTCLHVQTIPEGRRMVRHLLTEAQQWETVRFLSIINKTAQECLRLEEVRFHGNNDEWTSTNPGARHTRRSVADEGAGFGSRKNVGEDLGTLHRQSEVWGSLGLLPG